MQVVSMINGSLLSESASYYALAYANSVGLPLTALFVNNGHESVERVTQTVNALRELAEAQGVSFEFVQLEGQVVAQLQHYCQLYAVDTLFCATRRQSADGSFSEKIVKSGIETDIAVIKVKNVPLVRSVQRLMLVSREHICPHAYVVWLGLLKHYDAKGRIHLSAQKAFARASTKSGLKYNAAPFMQLATLSGCAEDQVQIANSLQALNPEQMQRYLVEHNIDLVVFTAEAYPAKTLHTLGDNCSMNSIVFHPWKG